MPELERDRYLVIYNLSNFLLAISVSKSLDPGVSGSDLYISLCLTTLTLHAFKMNTLTKLYGLPGCLIMGRKLNYHVTVICKIIFLKNIFCL